MAEEAGKAGGDAGSDPGGESKEKNTVSYETHSKLLGEKKKLQERFEALEKEKKEREEKELVEQKRFKELSDTKEKELLEERQKRQALEEQVSNGVKLNAFLGAVGGDIDQKYWSLVDLSKISVDSEGQPEESSVKSYAQEFSKAFSEVIKKADGGNGKKMPNDAANGKGGTGLTVEEWKKLPLAEMKKRLGEVQFNS